MRYSDFNGDGVYKATDAISYDEVIIEDVFYTNNKTTPVRIILRDGDTFEYIRNIIEVRKELPEFVERQERDEKSKIKAIGELSKIKDRENLIKKIKSTFLKYSVDDNFPYRQLADIIKKKPFYNEVTSYDDDEELNVDLLMDLIISQSVYSLEHYTMIHPKIKLLINEINKSDTTEEIE